MALPVNGSTHLIPALLLIYRPIKDERLSWPSWLTCSGWLTHISGHPSAAGRAHGRQGKFASQRPTFYHCATPPTRQKDVPLFLKIPKFAYNTVQHWWIRSCRTKSQISPHRLVTDTDRHRVIFIYLFIHLFIMTSYTVFFLFCSSNQQSQAVAFHNELGRKATKHRQLPTI